MGGGCTKPRESNVTQPTTSLDHAVNTEFSPFLRLDHPLNVNHQYTSFTTIIPNQYRGNGIRRTNAYTCNLTKEELAEKRKEFWETRVEGRQECWLTLKSSIQKEDEETCKTFLSAGGMQVVSQTLQMAYDERGRKYDIPVFILNQPQSYAQVSLQQSNIIKDFEKEVILVKLRCTKVHGDIKIQTENTMKIKDLQTGFMEKSGKAFSQMRLFHAGRQLLDHHNLGNYLIANDTIINVFAFD